MTKLKRGYTWILDEGGNVILKYDPPLCDDKPALIAVTKACQYSLAAFMLRVLRRKGKRK